MDEEDPLLLFRGAPRGLPRAELRAFAETLSATVAGGRRFCCLIAGDRELRRLNREFRGKDYPADVLSFPSKDSPSLGELAISAGRAVAQASEFQHDMETEIRILMLHGILHLMGYDHESDRGAMNRVERQWRKTLGLPNSLIERARR